MKKIIIFSLFIITLISTFYSSLAFEIESKELKSLGKCENYLTYKGNVFHVFYVVYNKGEKNYPAYCLNQDLNGVSNDYNYSITGQELLKDEKAWRAIINGYPYKTLESLGVQNEHEAYTATKVAVYAMMYDRKIEDHAPVDSDAGRRTYNAFKQIVTNARNSKETIEDLSMKISSLNDWEIDNINNEYVSKTYCINSKIDKGSFNINIEGTLPEGSLLTDINNNIKSSFEINEKFKIIIPIKNLNINNSFKIISKVNLETKPVVYGKTNVPGTQDYAIAGFVYEDSTAELLDNYQKNITKLIIKKQEYGTDKILPGVIFNVLDNEHKLIKENLITDENGLIILENFIPGTYYLQEVETLEGYNLYTDLIEVKINLNEEVQMIVNNTIKNETEVNKSFETITVNESNKENVTNFENVSNIQNTVNEENVINERNITNESNNIEIKNEVKKLPKTGF